MPSISYLFSRPERGLGLLVHLPDVMVLDGEDDEAPGVVLQERLVFGALSRLLGLQAQRKMKVKIFCSHSHHDTTIVDEYRKTHVSMDTGFSMLNT